MNPDWISYKLTSDSQGFRLDFIVLRGDRNIHEMNLEEGLDEKIRKIALVRYNLKDGLKVLSQTDITNDIKRMNDINNLDD